MQIRMNPTLRLNKEDPIKKWTLTYPNWNKSQLGPKKDPIKKRYLQG